MEILIAAFIGGFLGSLFVPLARAMAAAIRNRQQHKRLMEQEPFRAAWGRNVMSFFLLHGGFNRGG
jgi:hypothetical protein